MPPKRCSSATGWSLRCPLSNPGSLPASALPLSVCFSHVLLLCFPYGTDHNRAAKIGGFHFGSFQTILANLCQRRHALSRSSREFCYRFHKLFTICSNFIQRRVDDYKNGIIRYKHLKDHIVIIGFDEIMPSLVRQKCEEYKKSDNKILILSKKNSRQVREHINSMIKKEDQERIVVYCGRRDSMDELEKLDIKEAKEVYILGNRENEGHDALNIDCLLKMGKIIGKRQKRESKISVTVMFDNYATFAAFQSSDLSKRWRDSFIFKPFNFYEYWAQKMIIDHSYNETDEDETDKEYQNKYPRIEGEEPLKDTNDIVNIIIYSNFNR